MDERRRAVEDVVAPMLDFYKGKRVFVTGHTGFKGAWLCAILSMAGAEVTGYALPPAEGPNLYEIAQIGGHMNSRFGDVRDLASLQAAFHAAKPEIVFHLAAQPIVRESYRDPVGTYGTNVMGTVHLLECVRQSDVVRSVVNVTTDKVYRNNEWCWGYRENDALGGFDPYANSKSCSELATESYQNSFLAERGIAVSTARAGNVIGGGDFAKDRIIPDCVRAVLAGETIKLRNPYSLRPYQHVLEALSAYLLIAQRQYEDIDLADCYNVGPDESDCVTTGKLVEMFCAAWGKEARWEVTGNGDGPHEDGLLKLDCEKIRSALGWEPAWDLTRAVEETVVWAKTWRDGNNVPLYMEGQMNAYFNRGA